MFYYLYFSLHDYEEFTLFTTIFLGPRIMLGIEKAPMHISYMNEEHMKEWVSVFIFTIKEELLYL